MKNFLRDFFIPCKENGFKPRILETQVFFVLVGLLVGLKILAVVSFWGNFGATILNQVSQEDLYVMTNEARANNGVGKLQTSSRLEAVAQLKLADMFQNNYFAHTSPVGIEPWHWFDKANYNYRIAGENLAMDFMSSDEVFNAWLNSETHRNNLLLNEFQEVGIAVGTGMINGKETVVVVQEFGSPRIPALAVQVKPVATPKIGLIFTPVVTPKPNFTPKPSITPAPTVVQTPVATPKPVVKADPISLRKALATVPQVKSVVEEKSLMKDYGPFSFFANDSLKKIMILFSVVAVLILFLKVFVAFRVQFPALIFRAVLLIAISLSFVLIKSDKFMFDKIQITEKAAINISNGK